MVDIGSERAANDSWPDPLPPMDELRAAWADRTSFWRAEASSHALLGLEDVHALVTDGRARYPQAMILQEGAPAATSSYTRTRSVNGSAVPGFLNLESIRTILADGGSLQLNDLQSHSARLERLCTALSESVGLPFSAMAFLSPPSRSAFVVHRDPLHVLVLQTFGRKIWEVYPPIGDGHTSGPVELAADTQPAQIVTLEAGDALYMPPGWPHRATSEDEWSLHVSLVTAPVEIAHLLRQAVHSMLSGASREVPLDLFGATGVGLAALKDAGQRLASQLEAANWESILHRALAALRDKGTADLSDLLPLDSQSALVEHGATWADRLERTD